jgi:DNA-binding SARP family transcriptional activator/tetratricopeptide (TPR) repeat protein
VDFRILGPLEAWHEGVPVQLGDQQQRFVLVVLLLHANKPVSSARLTEIVWGENQARRDLVRGYIKRLRDAFAATDDVVIDTTPTGYLLRIDPDQLDATRFDRLRTEAEAARASDPQRAIELWRQAVGLWRGDFLEDIDIDRVGGTDVYRPEDSFFDALGDLAELELAVGDHRSARDRLRPVVRGRPSHQKLAELLMRALLSGNDRTAALRVFNGTRDALAEEGIEPGLVLRNLAGMAEHGEPPNSLPARPSAFTGRTDELAAIQAAAGKHHAVWVSGAPAVGKTGLAVEAAYRLRRRFPDGQLLARLNGFTPGVPATSIGDALTQLLVELGVPAEQIPATDGRKIRLYQTKLYGTRTLVVLDNAASPEQVRPLLPEAPDCFAIVTSRRMGDPDTGEPVRLAPLPHEDAVALFQELTDPPRVRGRAEEVAAVVRRCGHLPLPIHLAAGLFRRHAGWPLEHLLQLLDESGPWDEDGTAVVRVSYQQLDDQQRALFRLLGHLPGPDVAVTGAAALAGRDVATARALLDDLHEVSLLEEGAVERYHMLDPLKEFAAAEHPASREALRGLLDFYLVTLADAVTIGYPFDRTQLPAGNHTTPVAQALPGKDAALAWIAAERDNLVAAIRYASTHDLPDHTWRLAVLMWRHFNTTSRFADWIETMDLAWRTVSADAGQSDEYGQAHVLLRLAIARDRLGQVTEAMELAAAALPKWTRLGDTHGEASTLCALAISTMSLGRHAEAIAHFDAALAKYKQIGDVRGQAHALSLLGYLNELQGNLDVALRQQQAAVPMLREVGNVRGVAHTLDNLGAIQQKLGLLDAALESHTEAHRYAVEAGDQCAAAYALNNIGNVHREKGRLDDAVRYQDQAKDVALDVADADLQIQLFLDRGTTALARGRSADALRAAQAALDLADGTGNRAYQARADRDIAKTLHAMGRHADAVPHWESAETEFTALDLPQATEVRKERAALTCECGQ